MTDSISARLRNGAILNGMDIYNVDLAKAADHIDAQDATIKDLEAKLSALSKRHEKALVLGADNRDKLAKAVWGVDNPEVEMHWADAVRFERMAEAAIAAMPDTKALEIGDKLADAYASLCEMTGKDFHTHEGSCYQWYRAARRGKV